ncbi:MAG: TonB-dependent siderophore receptor [Methylococcaceae bacterium]
MKTKSQTIAGILVMAGITVTPVIAESADKPKASSTKGAQMLYAEQTAAGKQSPHLVGDYTTAEVADKLPAGNGLDHSVAEKVKPVQQKQEEAITLKPMTVKGAWIEDTNDPYNKSYAVTNSSMSTKTDTPLMETPASIQVITKAVIQDQQAYRLEDVVKNVSGVQTQHSFGGDYETFVMRGFLQSTANYRNGIRIPGTKLDMANVERVEVLKGTSAMLYGFGDPGGFISTVTKQPSSEPYYSVEQRFGSYDFYRTEASATGPLSKEHGLNYRMDLSYLDTNSFRQTDKDRIFFAPTLSWQATTDTKLTLSYEHFDENNSYDNGTPAIELAGRGKGNAQLAPIPRSRTFMDPNLTNTNTNDLIDFKIDHIVNDKIKLNAGTVYSQNKKQWESVYLTRVDDINPNSASFGNVNRNYWFGPEKLDSLTSFVNGTFDFDTYGIKHKLLLGGEYYNNTLDYKVASGKIDTINIFNNNAPLITTSQLNQYRNAVPVSSAISTQSTSKALYFQDQITFWKKLHLTGGFRYDWVDREQSLSWQAPYNNDSRSDQYVSPRAALLYEATDWLSMFGSFSESFGPAFDYDNGGPKLYALFPATQFEGGLKAQWFDGRLNANLAYFDLERTQFVSANFDQPFSSNPFKGHSNGIELDIQGQVYDGLSLIGTYAHTNTEILEDLSTPANVGKRLPYAPENQGSIWLKYDFNDGPLKGFMLGSGVYASGQRFGDNANSYSDAAYARLDLMAGYKIKLAGKTLTTQLNINNVNDAEYFILRRTRGNLPAEPLNVMGSIKLEF